MPTLTTSGTPTANGDSTVTVDGSDRVQAPVALIDETQGWVAARLVIPTVGVGVLRHIFYWADDANNLIRFYLGENAQGGQWRLFRRNTAGAPAGDASTTTGTAGADATIIGAWTSTQMKVSRDGAAFATQSATNIPTLADTTLELLQADAGNPLNTKCYWMAMGTGTLTDSDASTINAFGNSDPNWQDIPGTITFLWKCVDFTYEDTAPGAGGAASSQNLLMLGVG